MLLPNGRLDEVPISSRENDVDATLDALFELLHRHAGTATVFGLTVIASWEVQVNGPRRSITLLSQRGLRIERRYGEETLPASRVTLSRALPTMAAHWWVSTGQLPRASHLILEDASNPEVLSRYLRALYELLRSTTKLQHFRFAFGDITMTKGADAMKLVLKPRATLQREVSLVYPGTNDMKDSLLQQCLTALRQLQAEGPQATAEGLHLALRFSVSLPPPPETGDKRDTRQLASSFLEQLQSTPCLTYFSDATTTLTPGPKVFLRHVSSTARPLLPSAVLHHVTSLVHPSINKASYGLWTAAKDAAAREAQPLFDRTKLLPRGPRQLLKSFLPCRLALCFSDDLRKCVVGPDTLGVSMQGCEHFREDAAAIPNLMEALGHLLEEVAKRLTTRHMPETLTLVERMGRFDVRWSPQEVALHLQLHHGVELRVTLNRLQRRIVYDSTLHGDVLPAFMTWGEMTDTAGQPWQLVHAPSLAPLGLLWPSLHTLQRSMCTLHASPGALSKRARLIIAPTAR